MGGKAKAWGVGLGLAALTAITGGVTAALIPGGLGFLGGAGVGAAAGTLAGTNAGMDVYKGQQQERVLKDANKQTEAATARELGSTPKVTTNENNLSDYLEKRSAKARSIFAERAARNISQKLGD